MVIAIVGKEPKALKQVNALGAWQVKGQKEALPLPLLKPLKKQSQDHKIAGKSQSDPTIAQTDPCLTLNLCLPIGNNILGQFDDGRIGDVVREIRLAYYIPA
jgi:hypothetical protein